MEATRLRVPVIPADYNGHHVMHSGPDPSQGYDDFPEFTVIKFGDSIFEQWLWTSTTEDPSLSISFILLCK